MSGSIALRVPGPSRQPSTFSTSSAAAILPSGSPMPGTSTLSSQHFRRLIWEASIPIVVSVETDNPMSISLDRTIETHYVKAPRISYLPLLLQEVKSNLLALMMDDATLLKLKDEELWFAYEGVPLRWHWPIGLLYDFHTGNTCPSSHRSASTVVSLTSAMRRLSAAPSDISTSSPNADSSSGSYTSRPPTLPWRLTLRMGSAPMDKLHSAPGLENCRSSFMSLLKEADFVRWGSTKRVTNLRRTEQDALWEGVVSHDFDTYWSVASKIIPPMTALDAIPSSTASSRAPSVSTPGTNTEGLKAPSFTQQANESQRSLQSAAPSDLGVSAGDSTATATSAGGATKTGGGGNYRSLPMRFYLVQGAPTVQEPVAPYLEDGRPTTLHSVLSALFPLLFPPVPTFSTSASQLAPPPLAYAVIQGIRVPPEAEIPWIGAALSSADGWISVCIHLLAEGERA